jgi:hypothetical protein
MRKIITVLAIIALFIGTASAYDANIWNEAGTAAVDNPIVIKPGQTLTFSYHGENFASDDQVLPYFSEVQAVGGGAVDTDMTVVITETNMEPGTADPYTDVGVIQITLDANAPVTGQ